MSPNWNQYKKSLTEKAYNRLVWPSYIRQHVKTALNMLNKTWSCPKSQEYDQNVIRIKVSFFMHTESMRNKKEIL